jgi:hypothetical protein
MPSVSGKTIGPNSSLSVRMDSNAVNTTQTIDIWGIQLEAGSVVTAFTTNTANPQSELAACQRYYSKSYNLSDAPGSTPSGLPGLLYSGLNAVTTSGYLGSNIVFPVRMRATPTLTTWDVVGNQGKISRVTPAAADQNNLTPSVAFLSETIAAVQNSGGNAHSGIAFQWVASAEL